MVLRAKNTVAKGKTWYAMIFSYSLSKNPICYICKCILDISFSISIY
jgi:hypothetical protein